MLVEYQHWPMKQVLVVFSNLFSGVLKFVQWCTIIRNAETNLIRKTGDMGKSICTAMGGFINLPRIVRRHSVGVVGHKNAINSQQPHSKFLGIFE